MERINLALDSSSSDYKIPYGDDVIEKWTKVANSVIYVLALIATFSYMFDTEECFYLGLMNGLVEVVSITFLLVTELPTSRFQIPITLEEKLRDLFGFLYKPAGRLAYIVYLALVLYGFSDFGVAVGLLLVVATLFNIFLYFKHPQTRKEYHDPTMARPSPSYGSGSIEEPMDANMGGGENI